MGQHRTREFVTRWAKEKATRTGHNQALILNQYSGEYMYEEPETWEDTKHFRRGCILVEIIQP